MITLSLSPDARMKNTRIVVYADHFTPEDAAPSRTPKRVSPLIEALIQTPPDTPDRLAAEVYMDLHRDVDCDLRISSKRVKFDLNHAFLKCATP